MPRATNQVASRRRRKKILNEAKGFWGRRKNLYSVAKHSVEKARQYQYRDRRQRKRHFRRLWITRINAAARQNGTTYSQLMGGLRKSNVELNRKVLAHLAMHEPEAFSQVVKQAAS